MDDFDDGFDVDALLLVLGPPFVALVIAWQRDALFYLSFLYGGWLELYWAIPITAAVCAAVTTLWAWQRGEAHPTAYPLLMACAALCLAGEIAWDITM